MSDKCPRRWLKWWQAECFEMMWDWYSAKLLLESASILSDLVTLDEMSKDKRDSLPGMLFTMSAEGNLFAAWDPNFKSCETKRFVRQIGEVDTELSKLHETSVHVSSSSSYLWGWWDAEGNAAFFGKFKPGYFMYSKFSRNFEVWKYPNKTKRKVGWTLQNKLRKCACTRAPNPERMQNLPRKRVKRGGEYTHFNAGSERWSWISSVQPTICAEMITEMRGADLIVFRIN